MMGRQWILKLLLLFISLSGCRGLCPRRCACSVPAEVHCTFRALTHIPSAISKNVQRINFGFNSITQISDASFGGLGKLELLLMHGNNVERIPDGALQELVSLQVLKLSYNKLNVITSRSFSGLSSLVRLHLDHNRISHIQPDAFMGLISLRVLHLESNCLTQIHPHTFSSLCILNRFPVSTVKILDLSENQIQSLSGEMMTGSLRRLEKLFIQGNPLSCDCRMGWMQSWRDSGVMQCKRDRSFARHQICPHCAAPQHLKGQNLLDLREFTCSGPSIISSVQNASKEETISELLPIDKFKHPFGNISLTLSNEHGTKVNLVCQILKPTESTKISWNYTKPQIITNLTLSLDVECPLNRDDYESFWRLLAYYSDLPVHLQREIMLSKEPSVSYRYKQDVEKDAYFYTGVQANVLAHPSWLMQSYLNLKLNRPHSSSKSARLLLDTHVSTSMSEGLDRAWVMIERNQSQSFASVVGKEIKLDCHVQSSGNSQIQWMLADGTKIKPLSGSTDNRVAVSRNGELHINPVEHRDDGVYYCIAEVEGDIDVLAFRLSVLESSTPLLGHKIGDALTKFVGEPAHLPCLASSSPDAEIMWIFPNGSVLNAHTNSSRAVFFPNGTLLIPVSQLSNNGYYKCVAINQHGVDVLSTKLTVLRRKGFMPEQKIPSRPQFASGVSTKVKAFLEDVEEASGGASETHEKRFPNRNLGRGPNIRTERRPFGSVPHRRPLRKGKQNGYSNQRKVNLKNKMDPQRWADLLAKVREKTKNASDHTNHHLNKAGLQVNTDVSSGDSPEESNTFITQHQTDVPQMQSLIEGPQTSPLDLNTLSNQVLSHPTSGPHYAMREVKRAKGWTLSSINAENNQVNTGSLIKADSETDNKHADGKKGVSTEIANSDTQPRENNPWNSKRKFGGRTGIRFRRPFSKPSTRPPWSPPNHKTSDKDALRHSSSSKTYVDYIIIPQPTDLTTTNIVGDYLHTSIESNPVPPTVYLQTQFSTDVPVHSHTNFPNPPMGQSILQTSEDYSLINSTIPDFIWTSYSTPSAIPTTSGETSVHLSSMVYPTDPVQSTDGTDGNLPFSGENTGLQIHEKKEYLRYIYQTTQLESETITLLTALPNNKKEMHPTEISFSSRDNFQWHEPHIKKIKGGIKYLEPSSTREITKPVVPPLLKNLQTQHLSSFTPISLNPNNTITSGFIIPNKNIHTTQTKPVDPSSSTPTLKETNEIPFLQPDLLSNVGNTQLQSLPTISLVSPTIGTPITSKQGQTVSTVLLAKGKFYSPPTTTKSTVGFKPDNKIPFQSKNPELNHIDSRNRGKVPGSSTRYPYDPYKNPYFKHPPPSTTTSKEDSNSLYNNKPTVQSKIFSSQERPTAGSSSKWSKTFSTVQRVQIHESNTVIFPQRAKNLPVLQTRPRISNAKLTTVTVNAGTDAFLRCDSIGEPKPILTWTKVSTGAVMTINTKVHRFEVQPNGSLLIQNVHLQDRGQYLCTVRNPNGIDNMMVTLIISANMPKMLLPRHQDVTVLLGNTALLPCQAEGLPLPDISWVLPDRSIIRLASQANQKVMLSTNGSLEIKNSNYLDKGMYKCIASNAAGADMLSVRLQITVLPPVIQEERWENLTLFYGNPALIPCTVTGAPNPSIRWVTYYGTQLRPSQFVSNNLFVFPNGTLFLRSPIERDSGTYECVAVNAVGLSKRSVTLLVKRGSDIAQIVSTSPGRTEVGYGANLRLDCSARGNPNPRIIWRTPTKKLIDTYYSSDRRMNVLSNGTLSISSVTEKDEGDYLCVARNKMGDDFVLLKVNVMMKAAKIEPKTHKDHKVSYGAELKVDCVASGLPNPEITWSLPDGTTLNTTVRNKRYVMFNNGTLLLNEVGISEEGDYTCSAENKIGKDQMKVHIKVLTDAPIIQEKAYRVVKANYGESVILNCSAKGEPTPSITWTTPDKQIISQVSNKHQIFKNGTLIIYKIKKTDSGNHTCFVRNAVGMAKKVVNIDALVSLPVITGLGNSGVIHKTVRKGHRVHLDCNANRNPFSRIIWLFPNNVVLPAPYFGSRITVHRNGTLDIHEARLSDSVELSCIAQNEGGETKLTIKLDVVEDIKKPQLLNLANETFTLNSEETILFSCSIEGSPTPEISWTLPNGTTLVKGASGEHFNQQADGSLVITKPTISDTGRYRCIGQNTAGFVERTVTLESNRKQKITNKYNSLVSIINGGNLHLHCLSSGPPPPQLTWTLPNGITLNRSQTSGHYSVHSNGTLTIQNTSVFDRGVYKCQTSNEHGSSTLSVSVIIIAYPPKITQGPSRVTYARPGELLRLNCVSLATPKAELVWKTPDALPLKVDAHPRLYGNKYVHPDGSLRIQNPAGRDSGVYTCTATNVLGSDRRSTYVYVF